MDIFSGLSDLGTSIVDALGTNGAFSNTPTYPYGGSPYGYGYPATGLLPTSASGSGNLIGLVIIAGLAYVAIKGLKR